MATEKSDNPYAAPTSPATDVEPLLPVSAKRELREWLGLTTADLLIYLAGAAIIAMFFTRSTTLDAVLAVAALLFSLAACPLGMKRDPRVSRLTNLIKEISYPLGVGLVVFVVSLHYLYWSGR